MVLAAHDGNELVHDAAGHPGEFVLRLLAEERFFNRVNFLAGDGFEQVAVADLQCGAAGQSAAEGTVEWMSASKPPG